MRALTSPNRLMKPTNGNGPLECFTEQDFEIEASDVGTERPHYLGHNHRSYRFTSKDTGRYIRVTTQPGYTCWVFLSCTP